MKSKYDNSASRGLSLEERFMSKVEMIPEVECWYWNGHIDRDGYAKIHVGDRPAMAHCVAYKLFVGPIPEGRVLDHKCRNRECVNPKHQEPVTSRENTMRSPIAPAAVNARMTHCSQGHELVFRSFPSKSQRCCPTCRKVGALARYHSHKSEINQARKERRDSLRKTELSLLESTTCPKA